MSGESEEQPQREPAPEPEPAPDTSWVKEVDIRHDATTRVIRRTGPDGQITDAD